MKKKFRQADGTEVEVEGTAEELAEYERRIREGQQPVSVGRKKKPVLHGAPEVDGKPLTDEEITLVRLSRAGLAPFKKEELDTPFVPYKFIPYQIPVDNFPPTPICWVCGKVNCHEMHIWCGTTDVNWLFPNATGVDKISS